MKTAHTLDDIRIFIDNGNIMAFLGELFYQCHTYFAYDDNLKPLWFVFIRFHEHFMMSSIHLYNITRKVKKITYFLYYIMGTYKRKEKK